MSVIVRSSEQMRDLGMRLAQQCQAGDVIVLIGDLGAGKTTLVQGMGIGLGISEPVTSPTFVIARVHTGNAGLRLIHVDAYRLGSGMELDDLDLDAELASGVTVIEWGQAHGQRLSQERLEIQIDALPDGSRQLHLQPIGKRWLAVDVAALERES